MNPINSNLAQTVTELPALVNNLLLLLSDKEKVVIKKRFNLDATRKHTLEEIGKEFSVTRERIRQIEKNALSKMKRNVFNTSLKNLHDFSAGIVKKNGGFIKEDTLIDKLISNLPPELKFNRNHVHLSLELHDTFECVGNTINFYPYVKERALTDASLKRASDNLITHLNKCGDVKPIEKIHTDLKSVFTALNFDLPKLKSLVDIDKRITLLDKDFVALLAWRHIHPRTLRDKILFILRKEKTPMHFTSMSQRIADARFDNRTTNVQAVHNELIRHEQFVLIGRGIYALNEWGYEKGTVANVIERVLKEKKELTQDEIINLVLKQRQVKKITILLSLKNNAKFERTGRKTYKLKK